MSDENPNQLSAAGLQRRRDMLRTLIGELHRHHKRRRVRRQITIAAPAFIIAAALTLWLASAWEHTGPPAPLTPENQPAFAARSTGSTLEMVRTDPAIVDRYRISSETSEHTVLLDDDALLNELAQLGRPAGIIRVGTRARLAFIGEAPNPQG